MKPILAVASCQFNNDAPRHTQRRRDPASFGGDAGGIRLDVPTQKSWVPLLLSEATIRECGVADDEQCPSPTRGGKR
jgi:hypothetical protein